MIEVLDLFAGAGGFSVGAHRVTGDVMGLELDDDAVATQTKAGMTCFKRDITALHPENIGKNSEHARLHLHASPPCQTFSAAGKGAGRKHIDHLCEAVKAILADGSDEAEAIVGIPPGALLVLEPARWISHIMPDSVSLEQVRSVLPIWEAYAEGMEQLGYFSWTALLNAEQYGVPQTRCRAWLGASLHKVPEPPAPTHSRYHVRSPHRLDEGVLPWVSMAEALGWGLTERGAYTVTGGGTATGGAEPFGNGARKQMQKAAWRDELVELAKVYDADVDDLIADRDRNRMGDYEDGGSFSHYAPAGVSQKSHPAKPRTLDHAAPTVTAEANHFLFDAEKDTFGENLDLATTTARRITVDEAGILQGFPSGYPWQGTRTSQYRCVGNAVPPAVAEAVLRSVL